MTQLLRDVAAGIRVLQVRDGIVLSESQILERARNIVMGLVGNYRIEALDRVPGGRLCLTTETSALRTHATPHE
jgi:hypothetical protein